MKIVKLELNKEVIGELQRNEMDAILGKGVNLSWSQIDSINTRFTRVQSCCGGQCVECAASGEN